MKLRNDRARNPGRAGFERREETIVLACEDTQDVLGLGHAPNLTWAMPKV
jgi:hypothetical protein